MRDFIKANNKTGKLACGRLSPNIMCRFKEKKNRVQQNDVTQNEYLNKKEQM